MQYIVKNISLLLVDETIKFQWIVEFNYESVKYFANCFDKEAQIPLSTPVDQITSLEVFDTISKECIDIKINQINNPV